MHAAAVSCELKALQNTLRFPTDIGRLRKVSSIVKAFQEHIYMEVQRKPKCQDQLSLQVPFKVFNQIVKPLISGLSGLLSFGRCIIEVFSLR